MSGNDTCELSVTENYYFHKNMKNINITDSIIYINKVIIIYHFYHLSFCHICHSVTEVTSDRLVLQWHDRNQGAFIRVCFGNSFTTTQ